MQSEVYRVEDDIAKFIALVNLTTNGDIIQVLGCPLNASPTPEAVKTRQWSLSSFWDNFFCDRKDNAHKLHGQYADLCDTIEKSVSAFLLVNLKSINLIIKVRLL